MVYTLLILAFVAWLFRSVIATWRAVPTLQPHFEAEVARLREEVDQLNAQLAQLTDEQQFMMRLLNAGQPDEDAGAPPQPPQPENS
jgi:hypothetical protein